ncbi:MAG: CvpA family protein [Clostridia bacterium]|nr:CvpA family protein [Clostridia bacterium]
MNYLFDLILLLGLGITVFVYYKRGFLKSVISVVEIIAAGIFAKIFGPIVTGWFNNSVLASLKNGVRNVLDKIVENVGTIEKPEFNLSKLFEQLPDEFTELIQNTGADLDAISDKFSSMTSATELDLSALSEKIAGPISSTIASVIGFVSAFFVALIVFSIAGALICKLFSLPILRQVDGLLGALLGIIAGIVGMWIFCLIIGVIVEGKLFGEPNAMLQSIADHSVFLRFFCKISPFDFIKIK